MLHPPPQGEHVGQQVWEGAVGVPHRGHQEGHHPEGQDHSLTCACLALRSFTKKENKYYVGHFQTGKDNLELHIKQETVKR